MKLFRFIFIILLIILNIYTFSHKRYENTSGGNGPNLFSLAKWKFTREKPVWPVEDKRDEAYGKIPALTSDSELTVTYINQSSFLIQSNDITILTDPIWSDYAGPFGEFGVERSTNPGIDIDQLPKIDVILITHSHYDHLDMPTVDYLTKIHKPIIITGLGVGDLISYCRENKTMCREMNWWDKLKIEETNTIINFVPAHHWSSRFLFDKNTTLWGGFVIELGKDNVYFAGDTGFAGGEIFKEIKARFDHFAISLLPIGAYKPRWFFQDMHTSPEEAVEIFKILGAERMIPMHYDTFQLSDEKFTDPLRDLELAIEKNNIDKAKFSILKPGESFVTSNP